MSNTDGPRQAVVIVHGMGEQRPLDTLCRFIDAALPVSGSAKGAEEPAYYSRPAAHTDSYEQRRFLAPANGDFAQTEYFEYHWAHLMQGNRLSDIWTTFRRMMLQSPASVPAGLRGIWIIFWVIILAVALLFYNADIEVNNLDVNAAVQALVGSGLVATGLSWLLTKVLPGKISSTFVDVVRYLDTSPRSYGVRRKIRMGMIDLLQNLHDADRYERIVVVAHSLGAYVAYDGITYLWTEMNKRHCAKHDDGLKKENFESLESQARKLLNGESTNADEYQKQQLKLWKEYRRQGSPWLVTDFVSVGTPMYMADKLLTKNGREFQKRIDLRQITTCPPQPDRRRPDAANPEKQTLYSYPYDNGRVLYHGAPFALVRWTNLWFPAHFGFFGDWFGGPLRTLFGNGIKDVRLKGNVPTRFLPALAHSFYFRFPSDLSKTSVTTQLRAAMDLKSRHWLSEMMGGSHSRGVDETNKAVAE